MYLTLLVCLPSWCTLCVCIVGFVCIDMCVSSHLIRMSSSPLLVFIVCLCDEVVATPGVTLGRPRLGRLDELTSTDQERGREGEEGEVSRLHN